MVKGKKARCEATAPYPHEKEKPDLDAYLSHYERGFRN